MSINEIESDKKKSSHRIFLYIGASVALAAAALLVMPTILNNSASRLYKNQPSVEDDNIPIIVKKSTI